MSDIFISYARSTQAQAERIGELLREAGYSVWRDDALPLHRPYPEVIEEHLREAKAVVVIWSRDAARSQWVRSEADRARGDAKLVQLSVDGVLPPMPFDQVQCADLTGWSGDPTARQWGKVLESVAELMGGGAPAPGPTAAPSGGRAKPLLAVLPFDNLSGDDGFLYFSDGVSEEILLTVAKTTELAVIARSSSFQFRGAAKAVRHVAGELNTTHLLDGSVRRSGDRVRISAQLVECASQTTLWSDRFDRDLSDVFALQDEIAAAVAAALKIAFAPAPQAGPIDPAAYDLFLRARTANPRQARAYDADLLREATERAPGFAPAWAALALTWAQEARAGVASAFEAGRARAAEAGGKALALDPKQGAAYAALALLEPVCGRFEARDALLSQALAAAPDDPVVLNQASVASHTVGRVRDAFGYSAHAHEIDPLLPQAANRYAIMLANVGLGQESDAALDRARARWPGYDVLTHNALGFAAAAGDWGRFDAVAAGLTDAQRQSALIHTALANAARQRDWTAADGESLLADLTRQVDETGRISLGPLGLACEKGLTDPVYDLIDRAGFDHLFAPDGRLEDGDLGLHILFVPAFAALRRSPRFAGLCGRLGLCHYWAATARWPDCLDEVAPVYDLKAEARRLAGP